MDAITKNSSDIVSTDNGCVNVFHNVCDVLDNELKEYAHSKKFIDDLPVALKFIKSDIIPWEDLARLAKHWKEIKHPNIVELLAYFHSSRGFCFVTEWAQLGNLCDLVKGDEPLSAEKIQNYIVQLVQALDCLHSKRTFHFNLKPQNILFFSENVIKICDFGLAQIMPQTNMDLQHIKGSIWYMSPETHSSKYFSREADLWSVGVVLYELLGGRFPNDILCENASVNRWHHSLFSGIEEKDKHRFIALSWAKGHDSLKRHDGGKITVARTSINRCVCIQFLVCLLQCEQQPLVQRLPESHRDLEKLASRLLQKNPEDRSLECPKLLRRQIGSETSNDLEANFKVYYTIFFNYTPVTIHKINDF
uniref:probable serine/threonine-protein kinase tsuA n=1 Tax=Erigeron canadensis TaxID=72917 RepID=UPI001CB958FC|nr:probable serine/threonine-protein kinase tsuA [Erigeron canadensis]